MPDKGNDVAAAKPAGVAVSHDVPEKNEAARSKKEFGGRTGPEPTRYGDWEKNGLISDF
ncbi:DUF1674 domain-containing protein [Kordiimonas pumila]|uniref:DUF1674 domain-containing protein n=1 Tax=Kordiimonas pumila TaxID=2161677 RepID=A0ABV7D4C7_9PROT|nr:DUF1674 domain-containing protein [Kordiimonas pumila]